MNKERTINETTLLIVKEASEHLKSVINALAGKSPKKIVDAYIVYCARHINFAADGYGYTRHSGRLDASKHFVRPALETFFYLSAALKNPIFLLERMQSEAKEELTRLRKLQEHNTKNSFSALREEVKNGLDRSMAEVEARSQAFAKRYIQNQNLKNPKPRSKQPIADIAQAAGMDGLYHFYKLYCNYTHGSLSAMEGYFDFISDPVDDLMMSLITVNTAGHVAKRYKIPTPTLQATADKVDILWNKVLPS